MKRFTAFSVILICLFTTAYSFAQGNAISAQRRETHSGIIHEASDVEAFTLLKLHCDALDNPKTDLAIRNEFAKYPDLIHSFSIEADKHKIYIKYNPGMTPNFALAILERVAINAYYQDPQGQPVYYKKEPDIYFRR